MLFMLCKCVQNPEFTLFRLSELSQAGLDGGLEEGGSSVQTQGIHLYTHGCEVAE